MTYESRSPCTRLFFALIPPEREARRIMAFAEQILGDGWQMMAASRLHVTMAIGEDYGREPPDLADRLRTVGDRVAVAPMDLRLDRLTISHRSASLRLSKTCPPLTALHRAIMAAWPIRSIALKAGWRFSPHVTLAYREGNAPVSRPVEPFGWRADRLALIRSHVGRTWHEPLGAWPLAPAQYALF